MEFRAVFLFLEMLGRKFESLLLFLFNGRESEHFSFLRNGSKQNSESFLFRGTAGIPLEITICFIYSIFRGIIFLSEIANPRHEGGMRKREKNILILQHSVNIKGKVMESQKQYPQIRFS